MLIFNSYLKTVSEDRFIQNPSRVRFLTEERTLCFLEKMLFKQKNGSIVVDIKCCIQVYLNEDG